MKFHQNHHDNHNYNGQRSIEIILFIYPYRIYIFNETSLNNIFRELCTSKFAICIANTKLSRNLFPEIIQSVALIAIWCVQQRRKMQLAWNLIYFILIRKCGRNYWISWMTEPNFWYLSCILFWYSQKNTTRHFYQKTLSLWWSCWGKVLPVKLPLCTIQMTGFARSAAVDVA